MKKSILAITILTLTFLAGYQFASHKTKPQLLCEAHYQTQCTKNGELSDGLIPYSQVQQTIYQAFENSIDTDYFISDNPNDDTIVSGRCFTPEAEKLLLTFYPKL